MNMSKYKLSSSSFTLCSMTCLFGCCDFAAILNKRILFEPGVFH